MTPSRPNIQTYGVFNLTPDSFSDGGYHSQIETLKESLHDWCQWGTKCFDLGAESTAPSNEPISFEQEWQRIEKLGLPLLRDLPSEATLSLDTYRPETFSRFYREVRRQRKDLTLVFNDVSGVIDEELTDCLKDCPNAYYVFSHTHVPERSKTSFHMDYAKKDLSRKEFLREFEEHMDGANERFHREGIRERIILDPCFGFSKTMEQNEWLLEELPRIWHERMLAGKVSDWLVGISRKSFLQQKQPQDLPAEQRIRASEYLHTLHLWRLASSWKSFESTLYFRVHEPMIVANILNFISQFDRG